MIFFKEYISIFQSLRKITHIAISYYKHERDKKKKKVRSLEQCHTSRKSNSGAKRPYIR
jgi:tRNA (Thr-GGU) A37 N-methylase